MKLVLEKLDMVKLELLRLRAMLLPEEKVTADDKKANYIQLQTSKFA